MSGNLSPQARELSAIYRGVLQALDQGHELRDRLVRESHPPYTQLLAIGKAAPFMAAQAAPFLRAPRQGFVLTKEAHIDERHRAALWGLECWEAGHPLPDRRGMLATERLLGWLEEVRDPGHLLLLLSGGASSLVVDPAPPLSLEDLIELNRTFLHSGLPIEEINLLRKHLSTLKGGGLGEKLRRFRRVTQLIFSDICPRPERLDLVGSGPALADTSTLEQALHLLERLEPLLLRPLAQRCREALRETSKELPWKAEGLADHRTLVRLARKLLSATKVEAPGWSETVTGDVSELATGWAHLARRLWAEGFRGVLVASGEPTVTLKDPLSGGRGGRCQELAARFACEIKGAEGIALLAGGSDGTDGPTPYAGAVVDQTSWSRLLARHGPERAEKLLKGHDATGLLRGVEGLLLDTGPTGQNLNDLYLLSIASS